MGGALTAGPHARTFAGMHDALLSTQAIADAATKSGILSHFTVDLWLGALLGAVVASVVEAITGWFSGLWRLRPLRRLLGDLASNRDECAIYLRGMFRQDNRFVSRRPAELGGGLDVWQNIPEVFGAADVRATADIVNLLGRSGRRGNLRFASLYDDWADWSTDLICVGGHHKSDGVLGTAPARALVRYQHPDTFTSPDGVRRFRVDGTGTKDYGLILLLHHPNTSAKCLLIMGLGPLGTEAGAYYFRAHAGRIAWRYGSKDFAIIVEADVATGREASAPVFATSSGRVRDRLFRLR